MDPKELTALLQNPALVAAEQTAALKGVLDKYPYFQAARALRLKGLRTANSLHYNKELKLTAAYTVDRGVLFDFITSEIFEQNEIAERIKNQEQAEEKPVEEQNPQQEEADLELHQILQEKLRKPDKPSKSDVPPAPVPSTEEEKELEMGKPLVFNRNENHSFSEWLKLTSAKPVARTKGPSDSDGNRSRKFELIEEFIMKSPKIDPTQPAKKTNLAEERLTAPEALMTETLARVYLEQKNYKKAIQAYKILILKNPEKSGFFADQIRAIEKLKEQNS